MNRTFTIMNYPNKGDYYGKFIGKYPGVAANKAFSKLSRLINLSNSETDKQLVLYLKDITNNNNNNKIYRYIGSRVKLVTPTIVNYNGHKVFHNYKNIIALWP